MSEFIASISLLSPISSHSLLHPYAAGIHIFYISQISARPGVVVQFTLR